MRPHPCRHHTVITTSRACLPYYIQHLESRFRISLTFVAPPQNLSSIGLTDNRYLSNKRMTWLTYCSLYFVKYSKDPYKMKQLSRSQISYLSKCFVYNQPVWSIFFFSLNILSGLWDSDYTIAMGLNLFCIIFMIEAKIFKIMISFHNCQSFQLDILFLKIYFKR